MPRRTQASQQVVRAGLGCELKWLFARRLHAAPGLPCTNHRSCRDLAIRRIMIRWPSREPGESSGHSGCRLGASPVGVMRTWPPAARRSRRTARGSWESGTVAANLWPVGDAATAPRPVCRRTSETQLCRGRLRSGAAPARSTFDAGVSDGRGHEPSGPSTNAGASRRVQANTARTRSGRTIGARRAGRGRDRYGRHAGR